MPTKRDLIDAAMLIRDYCKENRCEGCPLARDLGICFDCELTSDTNAAPCEWPDLRKGGAEDGISLV